MWVILFTHQSIPIEIASLFAQPSKYTTFMGLFSYFHGKNEYRIRVSLHLNIHTKKLIHIKVRNISFLALKYTFLGQNRLKMGFSNLNVLQNGPLMQDWVFRLRNQQSFVSTEADSTFYFTMNLQRLCIITSVWLWNFSMVGPK